MRLSNRMLFALAFAPALLGASPAAFGQTTRAGEGRITSVAPSAGVVEEIRRLEREYDEAFKRGDADAFERLHTDDFRMTARGRVTERAELLARAKDKSRPRDVVESLTEDDVRLRDYGQAVVTTGRWKRVSRDAAGKDTSARATSRACGSGAATVTGWPWPTTRRWPPRRSRSNRETDGRHQARQQHVNRNRGGMT